MLIFFSPSVALIDNIPDSLILLHHIKLCHFHNLHEMLSSTF